MNNILHSTVPNVMNEKYISIKVRDSLKTTKNIMQKSCLNALCEQHYISPIVRLYFNNLLLMAPRITYYWYLSSSTCSSRVAGRGRDWSPPQCWRWMK